MDAVKSVQKSNEEKRSKRCLVTTVWEIEILGLLPYKVVQEIDTDHLGSRKILNNIGDIDKSE